MDGEKVQAAFKKQKKRKVQPLYLIHNAVVPCAENGIYYGKPYWPSYGYKQCRNFAEMVYWRIWGDIFTSYDISGRDNNGHYKHSQILVDKDKEGLTVYESMDDETRLTYYTWAEYVEEYKVYRYFQYIKWPGCQT